MYLDAVWPYLAALMIGIMITVAFLHAVLPAARSEDVREQTITAQNKRNELLHELIEAQRRIIAADEKTIQAQADSIAILEAKVEALMDQHACGDDWSAPA